MSVCLPELKLYQGWDLSPNHGGFVELNHEGRVLRWWLASDKKGRAKRAGERGFHITIPDLPDAEVWDALRREWWARFFTDHLARTCANYVAMEDYAFAKSMMGATASREIGGIARLALWNANIPHRLHGPESVKLFATGKGNAQKEDVAAAVLKTAIDAGGAPLEPVWRALDDKSPYPPSEDLVDAYVLARMALVEAKLRSGEMRLSDLEHPGQVQVFQRATKARQISVLGREWIVRPQGAVEG